MPADPSRPPRPELLALLDAVKDNPDDDTPRLALADWLDEQGDPLDAERAKFIREDIAARHPDPNARRSAEELRVARLNYFSASPQERMSIEARQAETGERATRWLGRIAATAYDVNFYRGLPTLTVPPKWFLRPEVTPLISTEAFAFVQFVHVAEVTGPSVEQMVAVPEFRHVPGVRFDPLGPLGTNHAAKFFASPNLTGLRRVDFYRVNPGASGVQALANNPALARLRELSLVRNKLVDKAVITLAESVCLANLRSLDLRENAIGDKSAEALAASSAYPNLRELDLRDNPRLTGRGKQLLRDKYGDRVKLG